MKSRGYNFGAGPAMLPEVILQEVQNELLNWHETGMSILEIGHRTEEFAAVLHESQELFRELLNIPNNYHVLFLGGAARTQFAMLPMNLLMPQEKAGFLLSGIWSQLAYEECKSLRDAYCISSSEFCNYQDVPKFSDCDIQDATRYIYYTSNETINGVRFARVPKFGDIPLVVDMTSSLLGEPLNVSDYGVIFAGAQKNIAPAGLTIVIIREDLLHRDLNCVLPKMLDFNVHVEHDSLYATLPTFNCYVALKMLRWVKAQGGVDCMWRLNVAKANKLYDFVDSHPLYECKVASSARSIMNVCFNITKPNLEQDFLVKAKNRGLLALKGHRAVGGLRASLYNAMPMAGVDALVRFMEEFASSY